MLTVEKINELLGVTESYKAPELMLSILLDDTERPLLFKKFLQHEENLNYEWFQNYFESEHADRKIKKQDFTPNSISELCARLLGVSNSYFEAAAGTGGMMIQFWRHSPNAFFQLEELSDRALPFLLFNMAIRGMEGVVKHGDSLEFDFKAVYKVIKDGAFSKIIKCD